MPEKDSNTWIIIAGFLATLYGGALTFIYTMQGKRSGKLEKAQEGFVTDKTSLERFKVVSDKLDADHEQNEKQWSVITKHGETLASMDTNIGHINNALQQIAERSTRTRNGDNG